MREHYRISIEAIDNGFVVEVPDLEAIAKKKAEAKKKSKDGCCPSFYYGDCTKKLSARNVKEVQRIVGTALEKLPDEEYDAAFDEAVSKK